MEKIHHVKSVGFVNILTLDTWKTKKYTNDLRDISNAIINLYEYIIYGRNTILGHVFLLVTF